MSSYWRHIGSLSALAMLLAGCGGVPAVVESRPELPDCAQDLEVYLPVRQGPDGSEEQSQSALDCFLAETALGEQAELEFILMGTEGEEYRSVIQTFEDGTIDYYRENDHGWEIYLGCSQLTVPEPGIPEVGGCDSVDADDPG